MPDHPPHARSREEFAARCFPPAPPHKLQLLRGPGASNVVVKDFCLAGPHPGASTQEVVASLAPLLRAGVTTFVCLQPEMPVPGVAHPSLRRDSTRTIAATARPYLGDAQAIVDGPNSGFPQAAAHGGEPLSFLHYPIPEHGAGVLPDHALAALALELLAFMRAGEYLYVHCGDGNGRTGTVVAVLLGLVHGLSSAEALDLAQRSRNDRFSVGGSAPETQEQRSQVHRVLADAKLRQAAAAVTPAHSNGAAAESARVIEAVLARVRAACGRRGATALIYLHRYALSLAAHPMGADGGGREEAAAGGGSPQPLSKAAYGRLCNDAEWHLTPSDAAALWTAALKATGAAAAAHGDAVAGRSHGGTAHASPSSYPESSPFGSASSASSRFGVPTGFRAGVAGPMQHITSAGTAGGGGANGDAAGGSSGATSVLSPPPVSAQPGLPGVDFSGVLPDAPTVDGLFSVLRGTLPPKRADILRAAFARLAAAATAAASGGASGRAAAGSHHGSSSVTGGSSPVSLSPPAFVSLAALGIAFRPDGHPGVVSGKKTADAVRDEFFQTFPGPSGDAVPDCARGTHPAGRDLRTEGGGRSITLGDFAGYYGFLSACMPVPGDDASFEQLLLGCWPGPPVAPGVGHSRRVDSFDPNSGVLASDLTHGRVGSHGGHGGGADAVRGGSLSSPNGSVLEGLLRSVVAAEAAASSAVGAPAAARRSSLAPAASAHGSSGRRPGGAPATSPSSTPPSPSGVPSLSDILASPVTGLPRLLGALRLHVIAGGCHATAVHSRIAGSAMMLTSRELPPPLAAARGGALGGAASLVGTGLPGSGAGGGTGDLALPLLCARLRECDFDRDGCVSLLEFRAALRACGGSLPDVDSDLLFRVIATAVAGGGSRGAPGGVIMQDPMTVDTSEALVSVGALCGLLVAGDARGGGALPPARHAVALQLWGALEANLSASGPAAVTGGRGFGPTSGLSRRPAASLVGRGGGGGDGSGAIPIAKLALAFESGNHPAVSAGRALPDALAAQFAVSFVDAARRVDEQGPAARAAARGAPTPALAAYPGLGDSCVRPPFWLDFTAGVSAAYPPGPEGDAAFAHTLYHVWAGGAGGSGARRGGVSADGAGMAPSSSLALPPRAGSQPQPQPQQQQQQPQQQQQQRFGSTAEEAQSGGLLRGIDRLSDARTGPGGVGYRRGAGLNDITEAPVSSSGHAQPAAHAALNSGRASRADFGAGGATRVGALVGWGGDAHRAHHPPPSAPAAQQQRGDARWAPPPTGNAACDALLDSLRATLRSRGRLSATALLRALERSAHAVHGVPELSLPLPVGSFLAALTQDAGLVLPPAAPASAQGGYRSGRAAAPAAAAGDGMAALLSAIDASGSRGGGGGGGSGRAVSEVRPRAFVHLLLGCADDGALASPGRAASVDRAFDALLARFGSAGGHGAPASLPLDALQMGYDAAAAAACSPAGGGGGGGSGSGGAFPDTEDALLRQCMAVLSGPSIVSGGGSGPAGGRVISRDGWRLLCACDSLYHESDAAFATTLWAGWALQRDAAPAPPQYVEPQQQRWQQSAGGGEWPGAAHTRRLGGAPEPPVAAAATPGMGGRGEAVYHSQARTDLWRGLRAAGGYEHILA